MLVSETVTDYRTLQSVMVCNVCFLMSVLSASEAGLAISSAMALTGMFQWGVRQSAEVENQMTSVERVIEYSKLPKEADFESKPGTYRMTALNLLEYL